MSETGRLLEGGVAHPPPDDPGAVPVPPAVRQERIERLRAAARERDLAAVVIFSYGGRSSAGTHGHLRYLLDWTSGGGCAMLLLPVDGPPAVVVPAPFDPPWMRELCPWIEEVYLEGPGAQPRVARALLERRGITGRIGLIGVQALPHGAYADMLAPDPRWAFEPIDEVLHRQRTVKDAIALARLRRAAAICDTMFEALVEALRVPGALAIDKCYARKTGLRYHVDLHLEVDPNLSVLASHEIARAVKRHLKDRLDWVADVLVHVEPHL